MKVVILDKHVRNNLILFRHLVHRQAEDAKRYFRVARKSYEAFIHCETGELRFAQLQKEKLSDRKWKQVIFRLRPDQGGAFEIAESGNGRSFDYGFLSKEAYLMMTKTLHILNQLVYDPVNGRNPFWILRHVAHMEFILSEEEEGKRNFLHDAWHNVDREGAEKLLEDRSVGTYLFRKDKYAHLLENALNEERADPVLCITMTYKSEEEKVGEKTLVCSRGKWIFYDDDPLIEGSRFNTIWECIETMSEKLTLPLKAT